MDGEARVLVHVREAIAELTINRPMVLNALNDATLTELQLALDEVEREDSVRAVIITGAGDKAFVAGADIKEFVSMSVSAGRAYAEYGQSVFQQIEEFSKPVIAAVNGYCLGGGCELAMACHIRIAADTAMFGQPEVKLGLIPGFGGSQRLPRMVGRGVALEMLVSGSMINAARALQVGLVNQVVSSAELLDASRKLAGKIAGNSPGAVRACLEAVAAGADMPLDEAQAHEAALFGICFSTEDMKEGTQAFLEKRQPVFTGK